MIDDCSNCNKTDCVVYLSEIDKKDEATFLCIDCVQNKNEVLKELKKPKKKISYKNYNWAEIN